jgi:hypothetical protein
MRQICKTHRQRLTNYLFHAMTNKPCFPGCFYYTDSCFRKDCKNVQKEPEWVRIRREEYYKRLEHATNHPPDEDAWNK